MKLSRQDSSLQPETVRRDIKFARSLALATKLKFPFPHMVAVIVKDKSNHNNLQLFSQGTADIVLDACVDFYDGSDLHTLSDSDRKKVQDFYQRTSLTAYCTAFAYRPLTDVTRVDDQLSQVYLELPADNKELYEPYRSPTPQLSSMHLDHHQSADSLLTSLPVDENITDTEGCFRIQCSQIFIGMVTMQYQAQTEMVQLIDQLERACIRFVHFSKENELRSRVFSEKMGLESGWNCHISLLSERSSLQLKIFLQLCHQLPLFFCLSSAPKEDMSRIILKWISNNTRKQLPCPHPVLVLTKIIMAQQELSEEEANLAMLSLHPLCDVSDQRFRPTSLGLSILANLPSHNSLCFLNFELLLSKTYLHSCAFKSMDITLAMT
ncbi:hypothetical protein J6590_040170 [Homalodisca vitripennis]|nr:hypothetical protein J6590_040170 [Homalodisca vitripennis]